MGPFRERLTVMHSNFAEIDALHVASGLRPADGFLADLGLSSMQLDDPSRGFSFSSPGPLDMPMDPESPVSPEDIVNHGSEPELADLIYKCRKERHSRRIARALMKARPIRTTPALARGSTSPPGRAFTIFIRHRYREFQMESLCDSRLKSER
jgi:16S rRNA (cytosine1402-N4)-methyltransferase